MDAEGTLIKALVNYKKNNIYNNLYYICLIITSRAHDSGGVRYYYAISNFLLLVYKCG